MYVKVMCMYAKLCMAARVRDRSTEQDFLRTFLFTRFQNNWEFTGTTRNYIHVVIEGSRSLLLGAPKTRKTRNALRAPSSEHVCHEGN